MQAGAFQLRCRMDPAQDVAKERIDIQKQGCITVCAMRMFMTFQFFSKKKHLKILCIIFQLYSVFIGNFNFIIYVDRSGLLLVFSIMYTNYDAFTIYYQTLFKLPYYYIFTIFFCINFSLSR